MIPFPTTQKLQHVSTTNKITLTVFTRESFMTATINGQNVEFETGDIISVFSWVHTQHQTIVSLNISNIQFS